MNPIDNKQFSDDYQKFVLQDPNVKHVNQYVPPFKLDAPPKTEKSKKEMKKQKKKPDDRSQKSEE